MWVYFFISSEKYYVTLFEVSCNLNNIYDHVSVSYTRHCIPRNIHYSNFVVFIWMALQKLLQSYCRLLLNHGWFADGRYWVYALSFNSLWPRDAIWRHRPMSTLAHVMACCLTAPSHYMKHCWLIISQCCDIHPRATSYEVLKISIWGISLKITLFKLFSHPLGANERRLLHRCPDNGATALCLVKESSGISVNPCRIPVRMVDII